MDRSSIMQELLKVQKTEPFHVSMQRLQQKCEKEDIICRAFHDIHKDDEDKKVVTQEFDMVRFQFPLHQISNNSKVKNKKQPKNTYM